jgi:hypothetical protein
MLLHSKGHIPFADYTLLSRRTITLHDMLSHLSLSLSLPLRSAAGRECSVYMADSFLLKRALQCPARPFNTVAPVRHVIHHPHGQHALPANHCHACPTRPLSIPPTSSTCMSYIMSLAVPEMYVVHQAHRQYIVHHGIHVVHQWHAHRTSCMHPPTVVAPGPSGSCLS